jgi:hypothetical protein
MTGKTIVTTAAAQPRKRPRNEAELDEVAQRLVSDWVPGDRIQPWLVRHEGEAGELSALIGLGWSWDDIGRALHRAGITFRTGNVIPGGTLRQKAYLARQSARMPKRERLEPATSVRSEIGESVSGISTPEPIFKPIRLRSSYRPPAAPEKPPTNLPASVPEDIDDATILERIFGKSP